MKLNLSILFLFFFCALQAQICRHEIGIELGPNLFSYKERFTDNGIKNINRYHSFRYSGGFSYQKNLKPRWSFRTGLIYEQLVLEPRGFNLPKESIIFNTFSVPIYFKYNLSTPNWILFVGLGVEYNNVFGHGFKETYYNNGNEVTNKQTEYYFEHYISLLISSGAAYKINDKINIGIELRHAPYILGTDYNIAPFNSFFSSYLNTTNLMFSVSFKLGKKQLQ
jgi:hypothetical protein